MCADVDLVRFADRRKGIGVCIIFLLEISNFATVG